MDNKLQIIIEAKDRSSAAIKDIEHSLSGLNKTAQAFSKEGSALSSSLSHLPAILTRIAGIMGVAFSAQWALSAAKMSAILQAQEGAFNSLAKTAGISSQEWLKAMDKAAEGTLSRAQMISMSSKMMVSGLKLNAGEMGQLMSVAKDRAAAFGMETADAFNLITTAVTYQSTRMLRGVGIVIDTVDAYDKFAASIGTTRDKLSEVGQQQAFMNAILEQSAKAGSNLAGETSKANDAFERFAAASSNVQGSLGSLLVPVVSRATEAIAKLIQALVDAGKASEGDRGAVEKAMTAWDQLNLISEISRAERDALREATLLHTDASTKNAMVIAAGQKVLREHGIEIQKTADYYDDMAARMGKAAGQLTRLNQLQGTTPVSPKDFIQPTDYTEMFLQIGSASTQFIKDMERENTQYNETILRLNTDLSNSIIQQGQDVAKAHADALNQRQQAEKQYGETIENIHRDFNERLEEMTWNRSRQERNIAREDLKFAKDLAKQRADIERDYQKSRAGLDKDTAKKTADLNQEFSEKSADFDIQLNKDLASARTENEVAAARAMYQARVESLEKERTDKLRELEADRQERLQELEERRAERQQELEERRAERAEEMKERRADEREMLKHQLELMQRSFNQQIENAEKIRRERLDSIEEEKRNRINQINMTAQAEQDKLRRQLQSEVALHGERLKQMRQLYAEQIEKLIGVKTKQDLINAALGAYNQAQAYNVYTLLPEYQARIQAIARDLGAVPSLPTPSSTIIGSAAVGTPALSPTPGVWGVDAATQNLFRNTWPGTGRARWEWEHAGGRWGGQQYAWADFLAAWQRTGIPTYQHGGEFTVPSGYPHDTFPMRVSSGEHVSVTPAGKRPSGTIINLTFQSLTIPSDYEMQQIARQLIPHIRREESRRA